MIDEMVRTCRAQEAPLLALLEELVLVSSHSHDPAGTSAVAQILARELGAITDLEVRLVEAGPARGHHLVATSAPARASAAGAVALVGHHDTVFPAGTFEGFRIEGDIARGPGVLDMKGGLAIALAALRILGQAGVLARLPLRMVSVSDEEIGSPTGTAVLERELAGAAAALVFEAGRAGDRIITARKGTGGVVATAYGKAAHAGNQHEEGKNAIWSLARFVDRAQALTDYARGITVNVGKITGGQGRNTVPDRCEALIDIRFLSLEDGAATVEALKAAANDAALVGTRIELAGGIARPPLLRTPENVALAAEYGAAARAAGLGGEEAALVGGGSDASTTAALGIPSIDGLGPRGSGFHTHDELIEVSSLTLRLEALVRFLYGRVRYSGVR
jgi:glutamate carboxypeptidase